MMTQQDGPSPGEIKAINRYLAKPLPLNYKEWTAEDHENLEQVMQAIAEIGKLLVEALKEAGFIWDKERKEWIPPTPTADVIEEWLQALCN